MSPHDRFDRSLRFDTFHAGSYEQDDHTGRCSNRFERGPKIAGLNDLRKIVEREARASKENDGGHTM